MKCRTTSCDRTNQIRRSSAGTVEILLAFIADSLSAEKVRPITVRNESVPSLGLEEVVPASLYIIVP